MPTLDFKGKPFVYSHHLSVPFRELIPDAAKSLPPEGSAPSLDDNLIIHGDNLEALKALLPRYAGKVDVIYIDPPYNTGNEGWAYNDNVNAPALKAWLGKVVDAEDLERHDKWLCMMWPRLQLLRELLAEDAVIYVSIDDFEGHRLEQLMEDIFGAENNLGTFIVQMNPKGRHLDNFIAKTHEYVLAFAKDIRFTNLGGVVKSDEMIAEYNLEDEGEPYRLLELRNRNSAFNPTTRPTLFFPLFVNPQNGSVSLEQDTDHSEKALPLDSQDQPTCWTWSKPKVQKEGDLLVGRQTSSGRWRIFRKDYLNKDGRQSTTKPKTIWLDANLNMDASRKAVTEIMGKGAFDFPKPVPLVSRFVSLAPSEDALVLDSFAGSGTTAHAVLELNRVDGGNRKFILVETEDYADTLTAERVRRVINGVPGAKDEALKAGLGGSFTYCELGEPMELERFFGGEGTAPAWDQVARYVAYTATGETLEPAEGDDGFAGHAGPYRLHLLYQPDPKWMRSNEAMLDLSTAERIAEAAKADGGKPTLVFAAGKLMGQRTLSSLGLTFCQLPYSVHRVLGEGTEGVAGVDAA
jgi:adenine-specific DNA-methyltransferase